MIYTRQGLDGHNVRPTAPNAKKAIFERVLAADTDEGWLLVDPEELREVRPGAVVGLDLEYGAGKIWGVKWYGEWDLVWIGVDREERPGLPARKEGQVLHRIRVSPWNESTKLVDQGDRVL
jgi:hypothetical protein